MARPIDEKIVVMKLDNSDFQRKAAETTSMFGKLKSALSKMSGVNLGNTAKDLGTIGQNTKNINMEGLSTSVQNVANKFSAMSVIAITALSNIVNKAVDAGVRIVKSLSIDQVTEGFQEYETKMGAIQTILANTQAKGTTLSDVKASLEDLNEYADKTIYNFAEMTKNIGLFTNAGLGLEESTSMIKGFSNAAAASGTKSEDAARAAYQLSQGLSSGYIIQQDWMSLTAAGMGNDNMKRDLIAIAQAGGDLKDFTADDVIGDWKTFLTKKKWLTSDVMSTYLQAMAGDLDKATLKTMGLTEKQADLLIANAKTGEDAATQVRTLTQLMGTLKEGIGSGWATSFELIFGDFEEATVFWTKLSEAVGGFFAKSTTTRNNFLKGFKVLGGFEALFKGISNAAKPLGQIFGALKEGLRRVFPPLMVSDALKMVRAFKEFTKGLKLNKTQVESVTTVFQGIFSLFSTVWEITKRLGQAFVRLIPEGTGGKAFELIERFAEMSISFNKSVKEGNGLTKFIEKLGDILGTIGEYISDSTGSVIDFSKSLKENLSSAIEWVAEKLAPIGKVIKEAFGGLNGSDAVGAGTLVGIFLIVQKIFGFFDNASDMLDNITGVFEGVGEAVNNFASGIKYINLMLIAISIGILAVSLKTLEGIDAADLAKGLTSLAIALGILIGGMTLMNKLNVTGGMKVSATIIALAIAVSIMASALKKISDLDTDEMIRGIGGLVGVTGALALGVIAISKWGGNIGASSLQLIALAGAVYIMASAVKKMSDIDTGKLWKSIGALSVMLAALAIFLKVVDKTKFNLSSAIGVVAVAGALHIMVSAIEKIENIDKDVLIKGLTTIGIILGGIAIFAKITSGAGLMTTGVGLLIVAGAINALVGPITTFGEMKWEDLVKGLTGMSVALLAIAGAALLMNGGIGGAIGILIMAGALKLLVPSIQDFAEMTWGEIIKGFVGLAGGLALVAVASMLLTPAVPSMLAFGGALLIVGLAILVAGAGVAAFGIGMATLATLTAASVAAMISALGLFIAGLGTLIVSVVEFVVKLTLALIDGVMAIVPRLVEAGVALILAFLQAIAKHQPDFIIVGTKLLTQFMDGMAIAVPAIIESATNYMIALIEGMSQGIRDNGPRLTGAFMELMGEILLLMVNTGTQMVIALFGWIPGVTEAATAIGSTAEKHIRENFKATDAGADKGLEFSTGLTNKSGAARTAGKTVGEAGKTGAGSVAFKTTGSTAIEGFIGGMSSKSGSARTSGVGIANSGKSGAGSVSMNGTGLDFGAGFANGMSSESTLTKVKNAGIAIAGAAARSVRNWLEMKSPSRLAMRDGGHFGEGFAIGIKKKVRSVGESAKAIAVSAKDSLNQFLEGFDPGPEDNELHFKAVVDYDGFDPNRLGNPRLNVMPNTSFTTGNITATKANRDRTRQNDNINPSGSEDERTRMLLSDINDNISRLNPDQPVYLVINDKVVGQSVTKKVIDNYDLQYLKAERGLANA